ncbi:MAG: T9SS type A sorting domain-containing protein [Ignavibacteriaceae bacterium]
MILWKYLIALASIFLLPVSLVAQVPGTLWTKTLGGNLGEQGYDIQQTSDGGFIAAGHTYSFGAGAGDAWLIRTNFNGDTLWAHTYGTGGGSFETAHSVHQTSDDGFIFAGSVFAGSSSNVYLVKTNADGVAEWTQTIGGFDTDNAYSVLQTDDGGYIICGDTRSFHNGFGSSVWLIRTNSIGDTLWTRVYGGSSYQGGKSIKQTSDDGFIITGSYNNGGPTTTEVWLLKTDVNGDTLWTKTFGGDGSQDGYDVLQTNDGGYLIAGSKSWAEIWLIRTDSTGDTLWTKTYPGSIERGNCLSHASDGGFIITGSNINSDLLVIRTDENGDLLWSNTYGGGNYDVGSAVIQVTGGGYIVCGSTESSGAGNSDIWLVRIDSDGTTSVNEEPALVDQFQLNQNYPNPFNPGTTISWQSPVSSWQTLIVYDLLGREVAALVDEYKPAGRYEVEFDASGLSSGVYYYRLSSEQFTQTMKAILLK